MPLWGPGSRLSGVSKSIKVSRFSGLGEFFREAQWELELMMGNADWSRDRRMQRFARNFGGNTQSLESLVAIGHYKDGLLTEVRLYPAELVVMVPIRASAFRIAKPDDAQRVLERVERLSDE